MNVRPATFFGTAAKQTDLLVTLFHRPEGMPEAELLALVEQHSGPADASIDHQLSQLETLRMIEPGTAGDATWQLTFPVRQLLGFLLRQQTLTGASVIQAYVIEIDDGAASLEQAAAHGDPELVVTALRDLVAPLERLRNDSEANRERLTTEALELKTNDRRQSARSRFDRINHLWQHYLVPLRELLDTEGAMDPALDRLAGAFDGARARFSGVATLQRSLLSGRRTLSRLRRSVFADHQQSVREVEPLYRRLRHDTRLARGAARALELLRHEGWASLPVDAWLGLHRRGRGSRLSEERMAAYLVDLKGYVPGAPPALGVSGPDKPTPRIDREELAGLLAAAAPIDDVLDWLLATYGEQGATPVLRAYGWLHGGDLGRVEDSASTPRDYELGRLRLRSRPLRYFGGGA